VERENGGKKRSQQQPLIMKKIYVKPGQSHYVTRKKGRGGVPAKKDRKKDLATHPKGAKPKPPRPGSQTYIFKARGRQSRSAYTKNEGEKDVQGTQEKGKSGQKRRVGKRKQVGKKSMKQCRTRGAHRQLKIRRKKGVSKGLARTGKGKKEQGLHEGLGGGKRGGAKKK